MIPRYRDHAANERTWLAWVRTGITVMMLGFLLEKFEIFLEAIASQGGVSAIPVHRTHTGITSLALVCLGIFMISAATVRFFGTKRALEGEQSQNFRGMGMMLLVAFLMVVFGVYLFIYLYGVI